MAPLQCHARSKQTGQQCRALAISGGFVCRFHGGSIKRVKNAANRRLALIAIDDLRQSLETGDHQKARKAELLIRKLFKQSNSQQSL